MGATFINKGECVGYVDWVKEEWEGVGPEENWMLCTGKEMPS